MSRAFPSMRGHAHGPSRTYRRFDAVHGGCGRVSVRARPQPACSGRARARSTAGISLERVRPKRIRREAANFYELLLFRPLMGGKTTARGAGSGTPRHAWRVNYIRYAPPRNSLSSTPAFPPFRTRLTRPRVARRPTRQRALTPSSVPFFRVPFYNRPERAPGHARCAAHLGFSPARLVRACG